jgi:signal transduction histidine kinase
MNKALFLLIVMLNAVMLSEIVMLSEVEAQKQGKEKIDSLCKVLKTAKPDTAKVNTLDRLAYEFEQNNPDTAIYLAHEAHALAIKLNYKMGIANACLTISAAFSNLGNFEKALKYNNDALTIINQLLLVTTGPENKGLKTKILRSKAGAYSNIGAINFHQDNYPEALKNYSAALNIDEEAGNKQDIASDYNNIGLIYQYQGDYSEALKNYSASLKIKKETGKKDGIASTYNNIGLVCYDQGNYPEALKNYFISLKIFKEIGAKWGVANNYGNIGSIYYDQGNYPEALKNHFASLKIQEEIGNKNGVAMCYNNIGLIYWQQGNRSEALKNYFISLKICEEIGRKEGIAISYANIGIIYREQGNYNEALKNHLAALKIIEKIGDKGMMAACFNNTGKDYIKLKKDIEASRYLNKGLALANEIGYLEIIKDSYQGLVELDSVQGNFKKAFEHAKMYFTYRDSIVNKEAAKKTVQIQMQYEFDNKEAIAKAGQEKKDAFTLKEMQKQKLFRNALIGGFAFLLILGIIIFVIMIQYRELRAIKKERNRISGELHDDIGADLNRITMVSQHLQKKTNKDRELQEQLVIISEAGKMVLGNIGEIIWTMNPQKDNLEGLVAHIRRFVTEYLELNRIDVGFTIPDDIPERPVSDKYRRNIFLAIKEAIYNITKYSRATRVQLSMNLEKRMAGIEIHDNGTGFSVIDKQNWGNGLTNMDQRMKDIGGAFRISSGKDQGTLINFTFPVR